RTTMRTEVRRRLLREQVIPQCLAKDLDLPPRRLGTHPSIWRRWLTARMQGRDSVAQGEQSQQRVKERGQGDG
ncbi:hypothetical protein, partial [Thermogemmatispora sp.]|uniref:hypothetical protein n=1 Tax=Thermogemmatispora sp. TaxID=1968838 RepID=UPI0026059DBF